MNPQVPIHNLISIPGLNFRRSFLAFWQKDEDGFWFYLIGLSEIGKIGDYCDKIRVLETNFRKTRGTITNFKFKDDSIVMTSDLSEDPFVRLRINTANILNKKNGNHIRLNSSDTIQMYMVTSETNYKKTFRLKKERNREQIQEDEERKTYRLTQF